MGAIKGLMVAGLVSAAAFGGYEFSRWQNSSSDYRIIKQEGKIMLYSKSSGSYQQIQNIAGTVVVGSAKENLNGYDVLRTKEIAEVIMKEYFGSANLTKQSGQSTQQDNSQKQNANSTANSTNSWNLEDALKKAIQR